MRYGASDEEITVNVLQEEMDECLSAAVTEIYDKSPKTWVAVFAISGFIALFGGMLLSAARILPEEFIISYIIGALISFILAAASGMMMRVNIRDELEKG